MTLDEQKYEERLANSTGPRITPNDVDSHIEQAHYFRVPGTTATVCALVLTNGIVVEGMSACVSAQNFDEAIGREVAFGRAREKIWDLLGYALAEKLHAASRDSEGGIPE